MRLGNLRGTDANFLSPKLPQDLPFWDITRFATCRQGYKMQRQNSLVFLCVLPVDNRAFTAHGSCGVSRSCVHLFFASSNPPLAFSPCSPRRVQVVFYARHHSSGLGLRSGFGLGLGSRVRLDLFVEY